MEVEVRGILKEVAEISTDLNGVESSMMKTDRSRVRRKALQCHK